MKDAATTLEDVLALRPSSGDAETYRAALAKAEALRGELLQRSVEIEQSRQAMLLTSDTPSILAAEQKAAAARLAADRIDALLPAILADLAAAEGRETIAALRSEAEAVNKAVAALEAWQAKDFAKIRDAIAAGIRLEDAAVEAHRQFIEHVGTQYQRQVVRDAGELGAEPRPLPANLPRSAFPGWS